MTARVNTQMGARVWRRTNCRAITRTRYGHFISIMYHVPPYETTPQGPSASTSSPSKLTKMQQVAQRLEKKQKRKADESQLHAKRQEMDKAKVCSVVVPFCSSP